MHGKIAKQLDKDDPFGFESAEVLAEEMKNVFPSLNDDVGEKYPKNVLHWIGYIYRAWNIVSHHSSSTLYKRCKADDLLGLDYVHHTYDPEYCVEELEKKYFGKQAKSDYEVFRQIMLTL